MDRRSRSTSVALLTLSLLLLLPRPLPSYLCPPTSVPRSLLLPSVSGLKRIVLVFLTLASFHHIFFQAHTHTHIHTSILSTYKHTSCARVLLFTYSFWCRACVWRECSGWPPPTPALDRPPPLALSCLLLTLACMGAEVSVSVR